ncbi:MATE family efflux transporter [Vibrio sp.]|nr:MATE family efflux transporter [Vibrio sp.]
MNTIKQAIFNLSVHKQVLRLAIPMVISNITIPLLGLVDSAVIGHLEHSWYLGGVALGSTMISLSFWLLGFLRMSTTGLTAQSIGRNDHQRTALVLYQGLLMALGFAALFLLIYHPVAQLVLSFSDASDEVKRYAYDYFSIRVWGAPAALANFVFLGWLLGTQNSKAPMWMVIITNTANIILDILFVLVLDWKVDGAATASVISDYLGSAFALYCVVDYVRKHQLPRIQHFGSKVTHGLVSFLKLNRDIFIRSLCLHAVFSFMTFRGAAYGDAIVAANAVLMSFLMTISFGMDGFAYAIEAMIGRAIGQRSRTNLVKSIIGSLFWSLLICIGLTVVFTVWGDKLIQLLTDIDAVRATANDYLIWLIMMPLVSMWCFLLDGIFVGATKGKEMRNGMMLSLLCFALSYLMLQRFDNHGLWASMLIFMAARSATLLAIMYKQHQNDTFFDFKAKSAE